jgi:hypothetical protein
VKRWLIAAISLPIVILLGWFIYQQVPIWTAPKPLQTVSRQGRVYESCADAAEFETYEPVEGTPATEITAEQARIIANRVAARKYGFFWSWSRYGPNLVQTDPHSKQLAWCYVMIIDERDWQLSGESAAIYLDAQTGQPLVLVTNFRVQNPLERGCHPVGVDTQPLWGRWVAAALLALYLSALGIIGLLIWLFRRIILWSRRTQCPKKQ